jgi:hypothetical protein
MAAERVEIAPVLPVTDPAISPSPRNVERDVITAGSAAVDIPVATAEDREEDTTVIAAVDVPTPATVERVEETAD